MMMPKPTRLTKIVRKITSSGRDMLRHDPYGLDHYRFHRKVVVRSLAPGLHRGNAVAHLESAQHATKDCVTEVFRRKAVMIQLGAVVRDVDEELRGGTPEGLCAGHRQGAAHVVQPVGGLVAD